MKELSPLTQKLQKACVYMSQASTESCCTGSRCSGVNVAVAGAPARANDVSAYHEKHTSRLSMKEVVSGSGILVGTDPDPGRAFLVV